MQKRHIGSSQLPNGPPSMNPGLTPGSRLLVPAALSAVLSVSLFLCWLVQAFALVGNSLGAARWVVGSWLLISLPVGILAVVRWLRCSSAEQRTTRSVLLMLLALALVVRVTGADHEVGQRAYQDEGTYYHHAQEINQGKPWRWSFVYGHVSYYAGAFGLWLTELYPEAYSTVATAWSGTEEPLAHQWLALRLMVALLSAITVVPVFGIAWLMAGKHRAAGTTSTSSVKARSALASATVASALYIASPVFNDGSHLIISDYPSACLATFALYFVARVVSRPPSSAPSVGEMEVWRSYALAGIFAGLAAATKYPAGTVAVAIVAAWLYRCWVQKSTSAKRWLSNFAALALAGTAAMVAFIGSMPTFLRDPQHAIFSPRGMLFGLHQYSKGGWIGVVPESQFEYYLRLCAMALGPVALASLALGPLILRSEQRRRWMAMAVFPSLYLVLLLTMNMVVKRNLAPAIPILAALAGVTLVATATRIANRWAPRRRSQWVVAVTVLALVTPAWTTVQQTVGLARSSTREVAARWMVETLAQGSRVLRESYTPRLPPEHFFLRKARFAAKVPLEEIERDNYQYVLLAGNAFGRFLDPSLHTLPHHRVMGQRYQEMFERYQEVRKFEPGPWRRGPTLWLLEVVPKNPKEPKALSP